MMDGLLEDRCGQSQEVKTPGCSVTEGFSHYQSFHSRGPARFSGYKLDRTLLEHLAGGGKINHSEICSEHFFQLNKILLSRENTLPEPSQLVRKEISNFQAI